MLQSVLREPDQSQLKKPWSFPQGLDYYQTEFNLFPKSCSAKKVSGNKMLTWFNVTTCWVMAIQAEVNFPPMFQRNESKGSSERVFCGKEGTIAFIKRGVNRVTRVHMSSIIVSINRWLELKILNKKCSPQCLTFFSPSPTIIVRLTSAVDMMGSRYKLRSITMWLTQGTKAVKNVSSSMNYLIAIARC